MLSSYRLDTPGQAEQLFREIGVHPGGIRIMRDKAVFLVLRLSLVPAAAGNIIKQAMLSAGGEAAVSSGVVDCKIERSDVVLLGTIAIFRTLIDKLRQQPMGGKSIARSLDSALHELTGLEHRSLRIGENEFKTFQRPLIMGILNATPDSFYDGSRYQKPARAAEHARRMHDNGADIIDIGALSTRPGAAPVTEEEELERLMPVLEAVANAVQCPLSVDTWRARVAREAIDRGVTLINDVSAMRFDKDMAGVAAETGAGVVLMHMQGTPGTMQDDPRYLAVIPDISAFLAERAAYAEQHGINRRKIIIDPGIGFGKTLEHNLEIMNHLEAFRLLGYPVAVGPSRKSFIGQLLNAEPEQRLNGTAAAVAAAVLRGADIIRVHDVQEMSDVVRVASAIGR